MKLEARRLPKYKAHDALVHWEASSVELMRMRAAAMIVSQAKNTRVWSAYGTRETSNDYYLKNTRSQALDRCGGLPFWFTSLLTAAPTRIVLHCYLSGIHLKLLY